MVAAQVGNYQIFQEIGSGGMGTVFRGMDTRTGEQVALKHLRAEIVAKDPELLRRFEREGEALRLLNHPNIVKALGSLQVDDEHYLILELVEAGSLRDLLEQEGALPIQRILEISLDLADALSRAHRLHIIHRDLKPANVLMAEDGSIRLTDFGIARMNGSGLTETGIIVGTIAYLSPEMMYGGQAASEHSDIWALGVMIFEMLTGQRPFTGETVPQLIYTVMTAPVPDLELLRPDTPPALVDLVYRMMVKNPAERIPSVRLVGGELEVLMRGIDLKSHHPHNPVPENSPATQQEVSQAVLLMQANRFNTPTPTQSKVKNNLPNSSMALVGREDELQELAHLLANPAIRLITIMAPGGMGKTRLSLEAASQQLSNFENGVFFVELAPLTEPEEIVTAVAAAVEFQFAKDERPPKAQLLDYLRGKTMLLVLDNFEHLLAGRMLVEEIIKTALNIKILVTSREHLGLSGETRFILNILDFPDWETPEDALNYAAVKLFMESARRVVPGFELRANDLDYVARICRLVAGMPLGILLAASWLEMLSLRETAEEISRTPDFLEVDIHDLPERQRSIRAVFEYSWKMLRPEEQQVFMKLSIFRSGFTRDAAAGVAGATLKMLMILHNKSLLQRDIETGRFGIHELLRQYAEEKLQQTNIQYETLEAHAGYFAAFMKKMEGDINQHHQLDAISMIEADLENVRRAWGWAAHHHYPELLQQMAFTLERFHIMTERYTACYTLLKPALMVDKNTISYAWIATMFGHICTTIGKEFEAEPYLQEAIRLAQLQHDDFLLAMALLRFAGIQRGINWDVDIEALLPYIEEALRLAEPIQNAWLLGLVYHIKASLYRNPEDYLRIAQRAAEIWRDSGNLFGATAQMQGIADILLEIGHYQEALDTCREVMAIRRSFRQPTTLIYPLLTIATSHQMLGDYDLAQEKYQQSLQIARNSSDPMFIYTALSKLFRFFCITENYTEAKIHLKDIDYLCQEMGTLRFQSEFLALEGFLACFAHDFHQVYDIAMQLLGDEAHSNYRVAGHFLMGSFKLYMAEPQDAISHLAIVVSSAELYLRYYALLGIVEAWIMQQKYSEAIGVAALLNQDVTAPYECKTRGYALLGRLETLVPAEVYQGAIKLGETLNLKQAVTAFLNGTTAQI